MPTRQRNGWLLFLLLVAIQLPLLSSGAFSHDELQWAWFATQPTAANTLPALDWLDVTTFQYRPLTFNVWLAITEALDGYPRLHHVLWALLGSGNALLLATVVCRAGGTSTAAALAALLFVLSPATAYVHGWVATLADLLWVGAGLAIACLAVPLDERQRPWHLAVTALLTMLALLAKEAALSIPAACIVAWLCFGRPRKLGSIALVSSTFAAAYLALRLPMLMAGDVSTYAVQWFAPPQRLLEYALWPFLPTVLEPTSVGMQSAPRLLIAVISAVLMCLSAFSLGRRVGVFFLIGGGALLGPVLVLPQSAAQYAYGLSALVAALTGWVLASSHPRWRRWLAVPVILLALHAINVRREMAAIGAVQHRFNTALADLVAEPGPPLRLKADPSARRWAFQRLSRDIPGYQGIAHQRAVIWPAEAPYDALVLPDGRIEPITVLGTPSPGH